MGYLKAGPSQVPIVKTLTGAAALALLGVLAFGVSGAAAAHNYAITEGLDDSYGNAVCIITGAAGVADDPVDSVENDEADPPPAGSPPSYGDDEAWDDANLMDTDSGPFNFTTEGAVGTVVCAGEDEGGEIIGTFTEGAAGDCDIDAGEFSRVHESEYTNLITGTGHAEGTADLWCDGVIPDPRVAPVPPQPPVDLKSSFSISFVAGHGPLAITGCEGHIALTDPRAPGGVEDPPGTIPGNQPQDIDTCHGTGVVEIIPTAFSPAGDVAGFDVNAAFEATLSGDEDMHTRVAPDADPGTSEENEDCAQVPCT